jgi:hypothetical protein
MGNPGQKCEDPRNCGNGLRSTDCLNFFFINIFKVILSIGGGKPVKPTPSKMDILKLFGGFLFDREKSI